MVFLQECSFPGFTTLVRRSLSPNYWVKLLPQRSTWPSGELIAQNGIVLAAASALELEHPNLTEAACRDLAQFNLPTK